MSPATKTLLALTLAAAFGGFAATALRDGLRSPAEAATPALLPATAALPASVNGAPMPSLAPMLQKVLPAVVSVHSEQHVQVSPFGNDPIFSRLFPQLTQDRINQSLGSGVIVDAQKGYVLTNHHVIEGADAVSVTLSDGRTLKAEFLGSDPDTDVALMRIPAQNLTAIPLGNSGALRVGDFVVAVGNPFGLGQTVTSGIVSAVGRSNLPGAGYQNFIQTDASINPGNSGGALVDLQGRLVGINTASFNLQGSMAGNIGLGFAIPSTLANDIKNQLLANKGVVRRGTLGVDTQDVNEGIARSLGLSDARGAVVTRVYPDSPAAEAGLRPGDVIASANGQRIDNAEAWRNFQGLQAANARIALEIMRDGKPLRLDATLREQARDGSSLDPRLAGASFGDLPESLRRQSAIAGVLVTDVARGSRAERNGLRSGDVILASSSGQFSDLSGFRATFAQRPPQLVLRIYRNGRIYNGVLLQ